MLDVPSALDLTDLDIESLWTQCRETVEGPVVSHLPRTLWQMAMPKISLAEASLHPWVRWKMTNVNL